jgi:DNA-binding response OmpR family regulator
MNMLVDYRPASTQISEENKDPVPLYPVEVLRVGNLQIDLKKHIVTADARVVHLTPMEYELLLFFIRHEGQVLSREKLLEGVWDSEGTNSSRTIDVHIRWLREKIEPDPARPRYIHTVYGIGYKFEPEQAATRFTK